jgi:ubiquinone/menaquinone biosynthesis C-methylase UbiE
MSPSEAISSTHNESIISQFTKQAIPYSKRHNVSNENELKQLVELTKANKNDIVLDLACGPGIVSCAFAKIVNHVTGIDLTPAMIDQAKILQKEKGLTNITWKIGDITKKLPFEDNIFSLVVTRYSFHHLLDPMSVLEEMERVCDSRSHGRIAIVDITIEPDKVDAFNQVERIRDPSHVRALTFTELKSMMQEAGLTNIKTGHYKVTHQLSEHLQASFPQNPEDLDKMRQIIAEDIGKNRLGLEIHFEEGNVIHFATPITIMVGEKYRS